MIIAKDNRTKPKAAANYRHSNRNEIGYTAKHLPIRLFMRDSIQRLEYRVAELIRLSEELRAIINQPA